MFTVCPKCALTLVVTAADLRVAQGYVRCGRCSNVFNALARLSEDRQAAGAQAALQQSTPQQSPPQPAEQPP
ncbi:MAG TPA: MJ0042-type zinc finger domain-containing protein, partial [Steroidobacteraceae bacterium]|nr:MJ0042-type zinc finger domain-containing protein [Steroidobacteraceae bacterium]